VVPPAALLASASWREQADPAVAAPPGRFVEAGDITMFVQERGPPDGPTLLFVHGSGAWSGTIVPVMEALAERGVRSFAVDLPPFGYSSRPSHYDRPAQARRVIAAAEALGLERFTLVGHSFGAGPTVDAALLAQGAGQLDGLVLISGALGVGQPSGDLGPFAWEPLRRVAVAATFTQPAFTPVGLRAFVHDDRVVTDEVIARYRRPLDARGATPAVSAWLPELLAPAPSPSRALATYQAFDAPTLLLWGAEDHATPVAQAEALAAALPHGELVVWPDIGHLPHVERPELVVDALARFVQTPR